MFLRFIFLSMNMCVYMYLLLYVLVYTTRWLGKLIVLGTGFILYNGAGFESNKYSCQCWITVCISQGQFLL